MYSTIRDKYGLTQNEPLANGWQTFEFDGNKQVYMDSELVCSTTCGNLESYTRPIWKEGVKEYMRGLKSDYKVIGNV